MLGTSPTDPEEAVEALIAQLEQREQQVANPEPVPTPIDDLRKQVLDELIPIFVEFARKYKKAGIVMEMDASNLLKGGRAIEFRFSRGPLRSELRGTVTSQAIAFEETRYSPDLAGQLVSGPMLRLRRLTGEVFRNFLCERLTLLLRAAVRRS